VPAFPSFIYYPNASIEPRAFDAQGNPISNLTISIESSDPLTARYNNQTRTLTLFRPGRVSFYASVVAYGVARSDTLDYTVGLPLAGFITIVQLPTTLGGPPTYRFAPSSTFRVGAGAYMLFLRNPGFPAFDITFDDPTNVAEDQLNPIGTSCVGAGNIAPFGDSAGGINNFCVRYFPVPGTYPFHSSVLNASGTIIVGDSAPATLRQP
jgi:hypothetical protein